MKYFPKHIFTLILILLSNASIADDEINSNSSGGFFNISDRIIRNTAQQNHSDDQIIDSNERALALAREFQSYLRLQQQLNVDEMSDETFDNIDEEYLLYGIQDVRITRILNLR